MKKNKYYFQQPETILEAFESNQHGISSSEAKQRLEENGFNELPEVKIDSYLKIFFRQFKSALIYILLACGIAVFFMGEIIDAGVIFFVLIFNAIVGTIQEGKAQNTFLALKKFIKSRAIVLRDNEEMIVSDREVVLGDIIILREGEKVPADARLISCNSLQVNEAALTGESIPRFKTNKTLEESEISIVNLENMVYKGTAVVSGNGKAIVTATGVDTFLGSVAKETLQIDSDFPLKGDIEKLSKWVIIFIIAVCFILFILGLINGDSLREIFKTAVAISVSVIPEGLPIVITLVLASGVWRMGKKNVLVKKLQAVEVLGETKILAVDKTGTVTKNELAVEEVYIGKKFFKLNSKGYSPEGNVEFDGNVVDPLNHPELLLAGKISALNSSANVIFQKSKNKWKVVGDPTEGSMIVFSKKIGFHKDDLLSESQLLDEVPFDYDLKLHLSLHKQEKNNFLAVTGSPEAILSFSEKEWNNNEIKDITEERKKEIEKIVLEMSKKGLRIIGFAFCETDIAEINKENIPKLIFGGFLGIKDVIREEVNGAVRQVVNSGIRVVMITGDYSVTAKAIAEEAGIYKTGDEVLTGDQIEELDEEELAEKIKNVSVFARINPNQKLKIIKAYKLNGTVVAMTGDGVNDALSLAMADIGIGMGKIGTEVAKEASDLILLDDNFGNITYGVEEGRNIFKAIKRVVLYLLSTGIGEVLTILGALILGFPLPIVAAQILWLNLVTDGFLDVALAMEPKEKNKKGIYKKTFIINKLMIWRMFFMAIPMMIGTLYLFNQYFRTDIGKAWTISLTTLAVFQWFNVWNCRSEEKSIFTINPFSNKFLIGATVIVVSLQFLVIYNSFFQKVFRTVPLNTKEWGVIILVSSSILVVEELRKLAYRKIKKLRS